MSEVGITVSTFCNGNSSVFRALGVPFSQSIEVDDAIDIHNGDLPLPLQLQPRPRMAAGAIVAGIGVLIVFVGSWAAKKILDEFYAIKIRPKLRKVLGAPDAATLPNGPTNKWLFQVGIWYDEEAVFILLTIVGDSLEDLLRQEHLIPLLHSHAVAWFSQHGAKSSVHLYIAEAGRANLEPLTFNHVMEAQSYLDGRWTILSPTPAKPRNSDES